MTYCDKSVLAPECGSPNCSKCYQPNDPIEGIEKIIEEALEIFEKCWIIDYYPDNSKEISEAKNWLNTKLHESYSLGEKKGEQTGRIAGVREAIEEYQKWKKRQDGICACLGNCKKCGYHLCFGCLCTFQDSLTNLL